MVTGWLTCRCSRLAGRQSGYIFLFFLFIKTYLYRVIHNQTILIMFYSVALFLAKSKSSDN